VCVITGFSVVALWQAYERSGAYVFVMPYVGFTVSSSVFLFVSFAFYSGKVDLVISAWEPIRSASNLSGSI